MGWRRDAIRRRIGGGHWRKVPLQCPNSDCRHEANRFLDRIRASDGLLMCTECDRRYRVHDWRIAGYLWVAHGFSPAVMSRLREFEGSQLEAEAVPHAAD